MCLLILVMPSSRLIFSASLWQKDITIVFDTNRNPLSHFRKSYNLADAVFFHGRKKNYANLFYFGSTKTDRRLCKEKRDVESKSGCRTSSNKINKKFSFFIERLLHAA